MDSTIDSNLIAALFVFSSYLVGSIPFGLVLTRLAGLDDIRNTGSGNIGATNVLRSGKKGLAAATLILDGGKGWLVVLLSELYLNTT
jgi:glycerol-3-phosphate acyltransferase PlsY